MAEKKKSSKIHSNRSFEDLMSQAQLKALQPVIHNQITVAGRQILMQLSQLLLQHLAEVKLRSFAMESIIKEKLGVSDEDIAERVSAEEDKMFNFSEVTEGAALGDLVRLDITSKIGSNSKHQSLSGKVAIQALMARNAEDSVQTLVDLEQALVGMKRGEERTLTLEGEGEDSSAAYTFTVKRVSRRNA